MLALNLYQVLLTKNISTSEVVDEQEIKLNKILIKNKYIEIPVGQEDDLWIQTDPPEWNPHDLY